MSAGIVSQAAVLVMFPVAAGGIGAFGAALKAPSARLRSGVQHLAAGVVFAAVATEVLPDLREQGHIWAAVAGFGVGVAVLLALGSYSRRVESRTKATPTAGRPRLPVGLLVAVGIDLLLDGLLVGLGVTLGSSQGVVLTIALTLEVLFLGLAVSTELRETGFDRFAAAGIVTALGLATAVGAIGGAAVLGGASHTTLAVVLAFGAAALLYLVVEELLVEAHEEAETPLLSAMFFVGFLALFVLAELGG